MDNFTPEELSSSAASAFKAATVAVMAHAGECFTTMVKVLSEKYGHPVEEMIAAVQGDERWQSMVLGPILKKLTVVDSVPANEKKVVKKIIKKRVTATKKPAVELRGPEGQE
jgi:hypothetical protein